MIKVLVIDDAPFMRQIFKRIIEKDPELNVIATAENGSEGIEKIKDNKPDVITLDIEMPTKNGLETLKEIMALPEPIPTIMVSALDDRDIVLKALELGAFDFIPKPSKPHTVNIADIEETLINQIKAAAGALKKPDKIKPLSPYRKRHLDMHGNFPIIAIGTSSGGPKALKSIIPVFPANFPGAVVIVQHMPAGFTSSLANRLDQESAISVREASHNDMLKPGLALIAPGGFHLEVDKEGIVKLNKKPPKWAVRPCVDYMMTSLSRNFTDRVIGVILTGMGNDGAEGMQSIKENNGYGIIEDESTALVYGMPGAVQKKGAYDEIVPLHQIPFRIIKVIERSY